MTIKFLIGRTASAQTTIPFAPKASYLLAEYLGTDLSKISNELDKLTIITPQNKEITSELIEKILA